MSTALGSITQPPDQDLFYAERRLFHGYQELDRIGSERDLTHADYRRISELEDLIAQTKPRTLAGCAVKLRRVLDRDVGMATGQSDRDLISLAGVLAFILVQVGAPPYPIRPVWQEDGQQ